MRENANAAMYSNVVDIRIKTQIFEINVTKMKLGRKLYIYFTSHTKNSTKSTHASFSHFDFKKAGMLLGTLLLIMTNKCYLRHCS